MNSEQDPREIAIVRSWHDNAEPWSNAVRTSAIASREAVTNRAIVDAVVGCAPRRILDVGCGEGWLARSLAALGMRVTGIDVVPELIAKAVAQQGGEFHIQNYAGIADRSMPYGPFDAAVCNFSLLGRESVESVIGALPHYLDDSKNLIIQTLHPIAACGDAAYQDGWRAGSWAGFSGGFCNPAPWYFRTLESWHLMLARNGFDILECREPKAAPAAQPASVIFICKARRAVQT
jgi:2-polyprenyl-3-methyl-5-hydroxy-6-metoxy-1,4-benzoquinol methylase